MVDGVNLANKHDVVLVTMNHRLNLFGYLYLAALGGAKYANASNVGMLDLILALETGALRITKWSRHSLRIEPMRRSAYGFCQGLRAAVSASSMCKDAIRDGTSLP
jgi:hypothetical protein